MVYLRQDAVSKSLTFMAFAINIYLLTFEVSFDTAFPAFLLIGALVMNRFLFSKIEDDPSLDEEEIEGIAWWTLIAMLGIGVGSFLGSRDLFIYPVKSLASVEIQVVMLGAVPLAALHSVMMAPAEEQFFRGVMIQFFGFMPNMLVIMMTTIIGVVYHIRVYGQMTNALVYVAVAWFTFSYVAIKTRRLSPLIIAHILNNAIASGLI